MYIYTFNAKLINIDSKKKKNTDFNEKSKSFDVGENLTETCFPWKLEEITDCKTFS